MPTWVKVVLVIVLVGFAAIAVGIVVAARWVRQRGASLAEEGKVVVAEGKRFGEGKDSEACMTESLSRLKACDGFICEAKLKVFLLNCLETASAAPETCKDAPPTNEMMATIKWQLAECRQRGWAGDQRCTRLVQAVQVHCNSVK